MRCTDGLQIDQVESADGDCRFVTGYGGPSGYMMGELLGLLQYVHIAVVCDCLAYCCTPLASHCQQPPA
jgi:hypothetical protein